jgi:hypothetical protein
MVWQIATQTGWSVGYILRGVNYQTLLMMLSDAPHYVSAEEKGNKRNSTSAEGFFRSLMKK